MQEVYWLYSFEDWFGVNALFYVTVVFFGILAIVPFIDRYPFRSLRRRPIVLAIGVVLLIALVLLTLLTTFSPVEPHIEG